MSKLNPDIQHINQEVAPFLKRVLPQPDCDTTVEVVNPSNGRCSLSISAGCEADVNRVVALGSSRFRGWSMERGAGVVSKKCATPIADLITAKAATLNALDAGEMGKPVREAFTECGGKSLPIALADGVDLHMASETIARALLTNQGQICSVGSRSSWSGRSSRQC